MRLEVYNRVYLLAAAMGLLAACSAPTVATKVTVSDPTTEAWYRNATKELTAASKAAQEAYAQGKPDLAASLIDQGEQIATRVLAVPRPTLAVAEAASDLDDLYGRMLFGNRHYGWARLQFQKNLARWKHWTPRTDAVEERLKVAEKAIAECDRKIEVP